MMRNWLAALAAVAVLAGFSGSASAQLYKWVDEAGEIHYSDEKPGGDVESSVVPEKENFSVYSRKKTSNPIIRPHDRIPRKLLVLDPLYLWKSESYMLSDTRIGNYHVGKACTSRGPIMAPKVFVHHKKIFPLDSLMSLQAAKLINRLEFDSERVSRGDLNRRLQQTNGLTLHSTIIEMFLKTCAPNTGISARLQPVENVPPGYFSKNKVRLIVKWQLKSVDGEAPIYETETAGDYNGWERRSSSGKALRHAFESAVLQLMSDRQFVEAILNEPGSPGIVSEAETTSNEGGDTSDPGSDVQKFIDRLLDTLGDDSANEGSEAPQ